MTLIALVATATNTLSTYKYLEHNSTQEIPKQIKRFLRNPSSAEAQYSDNPLKKRYATTDSASPTRTRRRVAVVSYEFEDLAGVCAIASRPALSFHESLIIRSFPTSR